MYDTVLFFPNCNTESFEGANGFSILNFSCHIRPVIEVILLNGGLKHGQWIKSNELLCLSERSESVKKSRVVLSGCMWG